MKNLILLLTSLAVLTAGCTNPAEDPDADASDTATPTPPDQTTTTEEPAQPANLVHSVQEGDQNFFDPVDLKVTAGTTVTWDIVGQGHHTVDFLDAINDQGDMPQSGDLGPGDTYDITFSEPGTYKYYCKYHSNKQTGMIGTITVT